MKIFRQVAVLLVAGACLAFGGCSSSSSGNESGTSGSSEAEKNFAEIVRFWRARFPEGNFHYPPVREVDGPEGNLRVHIPVPSSLASLYQFAYPSDFLEAKRAGGDDLEKSTAADLLHLKSPLLDRRKEGSKVSYDGGKHEVVCDDFVVRSRN